MAGRAVWPVRAPLGHHMRTATQASCAYATTIHTVHIGLKVLVSKIKIAKKTFIGPPLDPAERRRIRDRAAFRARQDAKGRLPLVVRRAHRAKVLFDNAAKRLFRETCWAFVRAIKFPALRQKRTPEERASRQREYRLAYYARNREKLLAAARAQRVAYPEKARAYKLRWQAKNPEKHRAYRQRVERERRQDIRYLLNENIRGRIKEKMGRLGKSTDAILGYSMDELKLHLERQFLKGMGWHNRHLWHIDHIVPLREFAYTSIDDPQLRAAWALTNLRPVWAKANMAKGGRRTHLL